MATLATVPLRIPFPQTQPGEDSFRRGDRRRRVSEKDSRIYKVVIDDLDLAADRAKAACGGDAREAVKALLVANDFIEAQLESFGHLSLSATREAGSIDRAIARSDR